MNVIWTRSIVSLVLLAAFCAAIARIIGVCSASGAKSSITGCTSSPSAGTRRCVRWSSSHSRFIQAIQASPNGVEMLDDLDDHELDRVVQCDRREAFWAGCQARFAQHITHLVRQPDFIRYLNSQHYEEMLVMRGMGVNRQRTVSVQVFPYGDNRKLVLTQDITELERTDSMRWDFVANVSHEIKTPLTVVLSGFLETMRELPAAR